MSDERRSPMDARTKRIVLGAIGMYATLLIALALMGRFTFVTKTAVFPALFLVAAAAGRFRAFVNQWAVYLGLLVLFDSFRGYIYYLIVTLDAPVYMQYIIDFEQFLLGGEIGPVWLQGLYHQPGQITWIDKITTLIHGSHFLFFLLFGLGIWFWKREQFEDFKLGLLLVMGGGLIGYLVVPTVPPWMAAHEFEVVPPIERIVLFVYNTAPVELRGAFDTNPIAAMPSLHTAFPSFIMCVALHCWGWRALPAALYLAAMLFSLTYGGEHYVADELAGFLLALTVYVIVFRVGIRARVGRRMATEASGDSPIMRWLDTELKRKLALTATVLIAAEILGQLTLAGAPRWRANRGFVEREMAGRSEIAHMTIGVDELAKGDTIAAQAEFELALDEVQSKTNRGLVEFYLAQAAYSNEDYATVVRALGATPLAEIEPQFAVNLGRSYFEIGELETGLDVFTRLEAGYPGVAQISYVRARAGFTFGALPRSEVEQTVQRLEARFRSPEAQQYAAELRALVGTPPPGQP